MVASQMFCSTCAVVLKSPPKAKKVFFATQKFKAARGSSKSFKSPPQAKKVFLLRKSFEPSPAPPSGRGII
jgi:hypothetical protein